MKRHGFIFEKIYTMDNLREAFNRAKIDKSHYKEVIKVQSDLDFYLLEIQRMLKNKTYRVSFEDYTMFTKNDKGKTREIFKLAFYPHRIIQWALILQIEKIFLSNYIDQTYSSIPNRGIHLALKRLDADLRNNVEETQFCLKIDVKKFYPSIDHEINKAMYRKKFKDLNLLWLIDMLIDSLDINAIKNKSIAEDSCNKRKRGIAIGSLFSQWDGNFYLSPLGHWLKEVKKVRFLHIYCDDIVILGSSKIELHKLKEEINAYLNKNLELEMKDNFQIFPVDARGIDFIGYRHFRSHILLRKSTAKNMKRKMGELMKKCENNGKLNFYDWCSINSYRGWMKWGDCFNLYSKWVGPLESHARAYYLENIKNLKKG